VNESENVIPVVAAAVAVAEAPKRKTGIAADYWRLM